MKNKNTDWQISALYVGTVIGAGFASGQELMQFFVRFGIKGLWGVILSGVFFALLGGMTILMTKQYGFRTYKDLLDMKLGSKIASFIDGAIIVFLFLGFSVMLSGSGALFKEQLGLPAWTGVMATEGLVLLALLGRNQGVLWFNSLLTPLLIVILVIVSVSSLFSVPRGTEGQMMQSMSNSWIANNWLCSSFLYLSYNMISAVVVLVALTADDRNTSPKGGILGGIILCFVAFSATLALLWAGSTVFSYQIPMLYLAYQVGPLLYYLYGVVLWAAMITTAIADAYGLCRRLQFAWNVPYLPILMVIMILVIPFSLCDFAQLVAKVYPLFGYLSLVVTFILIGHLLKILKDFVCSVGKIRFPW